MCGRGGGVGYTRREESLPGQLTGSPDPGYCGDSCGDSDTIKQNKTLCPGART